MFLTQLFAIIFPHSTLRPFFFSLYFGSITASKAIHISRNIASEPFSGQFLIFLPTLVINDIALLAIVFLALAEIDIREIIFEDSEGRKNTLAGLPRYRMSLRDLRTKHTSTRGPWGIVKEGAWLFLRILRFFFAFILPIIAYVATAIEITSYRQTNKFVDWSQLRGYLVQKNASLNAEHVNTQALSFSESIRVDTYTLAWVSLLLYAIARCLPVMGGILAAVLFVLRWRWMASQTRMRWIEYWGGGHVQYVDITRHGSNRTEEEQMGYAGRWMRFRRFGVWKIRPLMQPVLIAVGSVYLLSLFRPAGKYNIALGAVPFCFLEIFPSVYS